MSDKLHLYNTYDIDSIIVLMNTILKLFNVVHHFCFFENFTGI